MQSTSKLALSRRSSFTLIVALFFTWGFLTSLNDVLVADFRSIFHLSYRSAMRVQLIYFSTCFLFSFPSSLLIVRLQYRNTMAVGLAIMSLGAFCFAHAATFAFFLCALAILACGSTALQTAAGPFVSLLGSEETASGRFSLALAVNSLGAMLASGFGATFLLHNTVLTEAAQTTSLRKPYLCIAAGLVTLAFIVFILRFPPLHASTIVDIESEASATYRLLLKRPKLVFGVLTLFLYVGAEIAIGSLLINFLGQPETTALSPRRAALFASLYGAGAMTGRFIGPFVLNRFRPQRVLSTAAIGAIALVLIAILSTGPLASFSLVAVGLCNSVMVPVIFTTSLVGLGPLTSRGSGLLVAALIGGALIPLAQGAIADRIGLHRSFILPAFCYFVVFAYGCYPARAATVTTETKLVERSP